MPTGVYERKNKLPIPLCKQCGKVRVKSARKVFCSKSCARVFQQETLGHSPAWKGDAIAYSGIHAWLKGTFGKADKCENALCLKTSKVFQWAKKKGKPYARRRNHFLKLCARCHWHYDDTPEKHQKQSKTLTKNNELRRQGKL